MGMTQCGAGYDQYSPGCTGCASGYYPEVSVCTACPSGQDRSNRVGVFILVILLVFVAAFLTIAVVTVTKKVPLTTSMFRYVLPFVFIERANSHTMGTPDGTRRTNNMTSITLPWWWL